MRSSLAVVVVLFAAGCPRGGEDIDPKVRADGHYLAGQAAYLKGDFAEAHKQFAEVRVLNPADPRLSVAEGEVYLSEAKFTEAIEAFEAATKVDPKRATTWSRLGYLYAAKGEKDKAFAALEKALAANPKDFNALETRADLQLEAGKLDEALKSLVLASEVAPDASRGELVLRATAELQKAGRGNEALSVLETAVVHGVKSAGVFSELGDRLVEAQRLDDAVSAYVRAAKADAKDPSLWELVGEVQLKLGNEAEAEAAFRASLVVKDRGVVHVALGRQCLRRKDAACAKKELDLALATSTGEELRETLELAELLEVMGRGKSALDLLRAISEESDQKGNVELHVRTARLAKAQKDEVTVKAACTRALSTGQTGLKCP